MTERVFSAIAAGDNSKIVMTTLAVSLAHDSFKHCSCSQSKMEQLKSLALVAIKTANDFYVSNIVCMNKLHASLCGASNLLVNFVSSLMKCTVQKS